MIRYAQLQISEGDILNGRAILENMLKNLEQKKFSSCTADIESKRAELYIKSQ